MATFFSSLTYSLLPALQRDFRDAEIYLIRYQQCMTRSMTLIKLYVVNALRSLAQEVQKRTSDTKVSVSWTREDRKLANENRNCSILFLRQPLSLFCTPNLPPSPSLCDHFLRSSSCGHPKTLQNWVHCSTIATPHGFQSERP